ncbi:hydroxyethylthiazole kinase [Legionella fairfieldensis]|uniref:hydroxyethylthiazole kinase n=1 Tax=Legionella fairfieldensis TaxID=45064 RepID=UPI0005631E0D|nr:hydroxyethylthiazole kinase [Legionella fairfieldensis]
MVPLLKELDATLAYLRKAKPLVLCLTNVVTMDFMANSLLALGAAPLMTQSFEELEELVALSQAITINLGTLERDFCERAIRATHLANIQKKPVVLDPVGAGASHLRTSAAKILLPGVNILRGNASEILALVDEKSNTKGVETSRSVSHAMKAAKELAFSPHKTVVVSGPVDFITDGLQTINLPFGSPLMPLVTGMGCTLTAVIAAFATTGLTNYKASLLATAYFGLCGQSAYEKVQEPGSYKQVFIDSLYKPDWRLFSKFISASEETLEDLLI